MAIGDRAAAKGLQVFPSTQDKRLGYQNDNQRGDELADEIDARVNGDAARVASNLFKVQQADPGHVEGRIWVSWV